MSSYWDTSCVLKLYCLETDSEYFLEALAAEDVRTASVLLETELFYALHQKEIRQETGSASAASLFEEFRSDVGLGRFTLLPLGNDVHEESRTLAGRCYASDPPIFLRTLDGLHLASAQLAGCQTIYSTDERMRAAAKLLGLNVLPDPSG